MVSVNGNLQNLNSVWSKSAGGINGVLQEALALSGTVSAEAQHLMTGIRGVCRVSHLLGTCLTPH